MAKKEKKKEKQKKKEKSKNKKAKKLLKQTAAEGKKTKKADKKSASTKMLKREIAQLKAELQARVSASPAEREPVGIETLAEFDELDRASDTGSVSERKKSWERHQYLRAQYEHHLESGSTKDEARVAADRDLRQRYGDQFGYSLEDLDSILS